jgi:molybdopterin molybdotransferase
MAPSPAHRTDRLQAIRDSVLRDLRPVEVEDVPAPDAAGRILAAPVVARTAAPPFDCSAMDGYAVRAADVAGPVLLPVVATVFAGDVPAPLPPGAAARIYTGATLPPGADAVVREESVATEGDRARFAHPARPGENVRPAGEDLPAGAEALAAGLRVGPRQAALLAAIGAGRVRVHRRPRVVVIATGDEVVSGRVPDSNTPAIAGLARAAGAEVSLRGAADRLEAVRDALAAAVAEADLVLTIGGVSVGARDLVPAALGALGAEIRVHGVPMKPGKPFLFALAGATPVLGLPGSPSACLVAFEVFARPALLARAGAARRLRPALRLPLGEAVSGKPGRARLLWARVAADGRVHPGGRDAAQVRGPALADALAVLPADAGDLAPGAEVETWLLDDGAGLP